MTYNYEKDRASLLGLISDAVSSKEHSEMQLDGQYVWGEEDRIRFSKISELRFAQASELRAKMIAYWNKPVDIGGWNQAIDSWEMAHKN